MGISNFGFLTLAFLLCISIQSATSNSGSNDFLKCFHPGTNLSVSNFTSDVIFTTNGSSYTSVLQSSAQNLRFVSASTPKPQLIIRPLHESHIQAAVICSRKPALTYESEVEATTTRAFLMYPTSPSSSSTFPISGPLKLVKIHNTH